MKKRIKSDEIDLIEALINIKENKLKIAVITIIFIILSSILYSIFEPPLISKTKIVPISIFKESSYSSYNLKIKNFKKDENENLYLNQINRDYLLGLFLEELQTKENIIKAIKNYQLIDKKKFDDEDEYLEAVEKKASKLDFFKPLNVDGSQKNETKLNWTIEFQIYDKKKWEAALNFVEIEINNNIKKYLKQNFNLTLDNLKLLDQFKLEDLELKIKNAKNDYDIETSNRLAFLKEQALIARKLNIENNTLEVENFSTPSGVISNLQTAKPYYMRGYLMIEKEIELIDTRTNKDAFTKNLFELENQRRDLLENKSLERVANLFNNTPIFSDNDFKAANIIYKDTEYKNSFSLINIISIAGFFGILFGIFYVMISNAIQQRK